MAALTAGQIYKLARDAGLSVDAAATAAAVALAESGGRPDAIGDVALENATWGPSVGLWQIRSLKAQYGTGQDRDASKLTDPAFNARSMASISGMGKNFRPWTTYTSGAYKKYINSDPGSVLGQVAGSGALGDVPAGVAAEVTGVQSAAGVLTGGWSGDAMKIGLLMLAGLAAGGLFIVGAVHAVSGNQGATS